MYGDILRCQLPLSERMNYLNAIQCNGGRVKRFEAEHEIGYSLYASMILLNNVVDILHLADFNRCAVLVIILFESRLVSRTSVDGDLLGNSIVADCFDQEWFDGQLVSVLGVFPASLPSLSALDVV